MRYSVKGSTYFSFQATCSLFFSTILIITHLIFNLSYRRKFKKNWYYCICFLICSLINYPYIILRAPVCNVLPKMWCRQKLYTFILKWIRCNVTIFDETRLNRFHFVLCILKFFSFCRIKGRREVRSPLNSLYCAPHFSALLSPTPTGL